MKNTLLIIFTSLIFSGMTAQDEETIAISEDACGCMEEVDLSSPKSEQYEKIKSCISSSILSYQLMKSLQNLPKASNDSVSDPSEILNNALKDSVQQINIEIVADKNFKEIEAYLLRNCDKMKRVMQSDETLGENSVSDKEEAIEYYNKGQSFYTNKEYEKAIKEYEKAVKIDKNFSFAWDKLGYSYRQLGQYKKAIKYYDKSLKINPKGKMPLMNKPIAYQLMGELDKAIESYKDFMAVYSNDPEGFYGIGRIYFDKGNYEGALDNMMHAYILYKEQNSPYVHDAESNIALFYQELEAKGQLELFNRIAKKYDIKIQE